MPPLPITVRATCVMTCTLTAALVLSTGGRPERSTIAVVPPRPLKERRRSFVPYEIAVVIPAFRSATLGPANKAASSPRTVAPCGGGGFWIIRLTPIGARPSSVMPLARVRACPRRSRLRARRRRRQARLPDGTPSSELHRHDSGYEPSDRKGRQMGIQRSKRPLAAARLAVTTRRLLNASTLCAIATVSPGNRAHVNTAYFAWSPEFDLVWLSEPRARHSRNIRANGTVAIAVYAWSQSWGKPDRGIQLFGSAREVEGAAAERAGALYAGRFPEYPKAD